MKLPEELVTAPAEAPCLRPNQGCITGNKVHPECAVAAVLRALPESEAVRYRHADAGVTDGADRIAQERRRQIVVEGWTSDHDDEHDGCEMALAAVAYTVAAHARTVGVAVDEPHRWWPWHRSWWKPCNDPIRNLVKAGALIAAEIDRLQRAAR